MNTDNIDFAGLNGTAIEGAIEELASLDRRHPRRKRFARMLRKKKRIIPTKNLTAKAEFEKRITDLPENIRTLIKEKKLQIIDANIYNITDIESLQNNIELMAASDTESIGATNINGRKLEANQWFLLTAIELKYGSHATLTEADYTNLNANILNGEFQLSVDSSIIVPNVSCQVFDTNSRTDSPLGYYKLANPKWIPPQSEIIPELSIPAAGSADDNVKIILHGAIVEKN